MFTRPHQWAIASGIALAIMAIGSTAGADSFSQEVTEARQESQIWTTYALNPALRAHDLKVSVHEGKATLSGRVDEGINKDLAKQIALGVSGIREVDNQIVVQADYIPPTVLSPRNYSYGEMIDDATITAAVKSKLTWSNFTNGLITDVETKWGKVTLQGTTDSANAKAVATSLALNTRGVVAVDNRMEVVGTKSTAAGEVRHTTSEAERDIADGWITTKIKSTYLYSSSVDGSNITVTTTNGVVTLNGKVSSSTERDLAIDLAKNVRGVKSVHSTGLTF
ncbi:BON domain-containing protein [Andreprevotia chitinilytica]|uniref:BON domain-containing protein n=1 Tax=Andreprevotia chitinilytica TaxID=396808 RepID=UPI00054F4724|nr:BON domain-containing protein [Andreprevotia chitinilytica]